MQISQQLNQILTSASQSICRNRMLRMLSVQVKKWCTENFLHKTGPENSLCLHLNVAEDLGVSVRQSPVERNSSVLLSPLAQCLFDVYLLRATCFTVIFPNPTDDFLSTQIFSAQFNSLLIANGKEITQRKTKHWYSLADKWYENVHLMVTSNCKSIQSKMVSIHAICIVINEEHCTNQLSFIELLLFSVLCLRLFFASRNQMLMLFTVAHFFTFCCICTTNDTQNYDNFSVFFT